MKAAAVPEGAITSMMSRDLLRSMGPSAMTTASRCRLGPSGDISEFDILILRVLLSTSIYAFGLLLSRVYSGGCK